MKYRFLLMENLWWMEQPVGWWSSSIPPRPTGCTP